MLHIPEFSISHTLSDESALHMISRLITFFFSITLHLPVGHVRALGVCVPLDGVFMMEIGCPSFSEFLCIYIYIYTSTRISGVWVVMSLKSFGPSEHSFAFACTVHILVLYIQH